MQTAGVILDIYDDHRGRILREKTAGTPLPEKLKTASLLSPEELGRLPDRLFAVVAQDGDRTLRKYAMHDEAHLATSIIYFMECGHLLPKVAQDVAAMNLAAACDWYDMEVPEPLLKKAMVGAALGVLGAASAAAEGSKKKKRDMDAFRQAQATGISIPPQHKTAEKEGKNPEGPSDDLEALLFSDAEAKADLTTGHDKKADLTGTEMMTHQEVNRGKRLRPSKPNPASATSSKNASVNVDFVNPYVDITGLEPPAITKVASHEHFALGDRYPIDTYGQVKQAEAYFDEHCHKFELPDRRTFAVSLVKRANDIGVSVQGKALDYAGFQYGPHVMAELQKRAGNFIEPEKQAVFEDLKEKVASGMDPHIAATALAQADQAFRLDRAYGKPVVGFRDPFAAVYGVKTAADQKVTGVDDSAKQEYPAEARGFAWNEGSDYVNEDMLYQIAETPAALTDMFGEALVKDFVKDPVGTFESLPDPQKHAIARLASDNSGGSYRT